MVINIFNSDVNHFLILPISNPTNVRVSRPQLKQYKSMYINYDVGRYYYCCCCCRRIVCVCVCVYTFGRACLTELCYRLPFPVFENSRTATVRTTIDVQPFSPGAFTCIMQNKSSERHRLHNARAADSAPRSTYYTVCVTYKYNIIIRPDEHLYFSSPTDIIIIPTHTMFLVFYLFTRSPHSHTMSII